MFNLTQNIELSVLFICTLLIIVMIGLLIVEFFKGINKKHLFFIFLIYLIVLIRIFVDIYFLYFSLKVIGLVSYVNFLLTAVTGVFFYKNRKKINYWLYCVFLVCFMVFLSLNFLSFFIQFTAVVYYTNLVLFAFYNILLYLSILSFLINIRNDT